ncbi:DUF2141 domain-containing protein [Hyphococcus sp. DH-69]|uniref:DUF2141 domain-containing protein n=1 Tax=Hyphococcus formosus TaxID=3143534 RepID=UPI00398B2AE9
MLKRIGVIATSFLASASFMAASTALAKKTPPPTAEDYAFNHVSCKGDPNEIRVIVSGIEAATGLITADLFPNKEEGFLRGRGRLLQVKFAAKAPLTKFCITAPESGLFAMSVYHDGNANGIFDKNGIGLPAEPWGISNNPKVRFAPPPVEKALFSVSENNPAHVFIKLN